MNRPNVAKSRSPGKFALVPMCLMLVTLLAFLWHATQMVAARLGYQAQLGAPWLQVGTWRIYRPWQVIPWNYWYHYYAPRIFSIGMLWVAAGVVAALFVLLLYIVWYARRARVADAFGTAEWAGKGELKEAGLLGSAGVVIGVTQSGRYLIHDGPEHVISIAPTRSGKGVGQVIPTLLSWPESVVVHDIKQENWNVTAGYRARFSHVLYFNPCSLASCHYNPLLEIRGGWDQVKDAQNVVTMLVDPMGKGMPEHWDRAAYTLLFSAILHVLYCEPDKSLPGVAHLLSDPKRNVNAVLRVMVSQKYPDAIATQVINSAAQEVLQKQEKELSGVVSTALAYLALYRDPLVARNIADSDFRLLDLMQADHPLSLYVVVPTSDRDRVIPLLRLLWSQIGRRLTEQLNPRANKHRLLLMMDEFPSLGKMEFFQNSLAHVAGFGIKAYLIAQGINQIDEAHGPRNSILDNCGVRVFYTPNDDVTAERISRMLGVKTEVHQQKTFTGHRFAPLLGHVMVSDQETARPLLTAGEVLTFDSESSLVFVSGKRPIRARKLRYFNDQNFRLRLRPPPVLRENGRYVYGPPRRPSEWVGTSAQMHAPAAKAAGGAGPASPGAAVKVDDEVVKELRAPAADRSVPRVPAPSIPVQEDLELVPEDELPGLLQAHEEHLQLIRKGELDRQHGVQALAARHERVSEQQQER